MKIAINTQFMENYGVHDWDGNGDCPQYWKTKGGSVYVIENSTYERVSNDQPRSWTETLWQTLRDLIEYSNDGARETIISMNIVDDNEKICDAWDNPIQLTCENDKWIARQVTENDEYAYLNDKIARMCKQWDMLPAGDCANYLVSYDLRDGRTMINDQINEIFTV